MAAHFASRQRCCGNLTVACRREGDHMQLAIGIVAALLAGWFFGCIITYKVGNRILVEGMGIKSAEFIMLVLYGAGVAAYFCCRPVGRWILLGVLLFWAVVQFFCHWYYFIFGASEKKLQSYHECFRDTVALFPKNKTRIVPDLYHVILHLLIVCELGLLIAELCKS